MMRAGDFSTSAAQGALPLSRDSAIPVAIAAEEGASPAAGVSHPETIADAAIPAILPVVDRVMDEAVTDYEPLVRRVPQITTLSQPGRLWWGLTVMQHAAATFDAWSTLRSTTSGLGYERDPLLRPFAGSPAIYPAMQVLPTGLDFLSRRMMRSSNSVVRKMWWLPQTAATVGFVWSGVRNIRVASR